MADPQKTVNVVKGKACDVGDFGCQNVGPQDQSAHIIDVASTDSGSGGDDATFVTAINEILAVLEKFGFTATS